VTVITAVYIARTILMISIFFWHDRMLIADVCFRNPALMVFGVFLAGHYHLGTCHFVSIVRHLEVRNREESLIAGVVIMAYRLTQTVHLCA